MVENTLTAAADEYQSTLVTPAHLFMLTESPAETMAVALRFIMEAYSHHEACIFVGHSTQIAQITGCFSKTAPVEPAPEIRNVHFFNTNPDDIPAGESRYEHTISRLVAYLQIAERNSGVVNIMLDVAALHLDDSATAYEHAIDVLVAASPVHVCCLYDRSRVAPAALYAALRTHAQVCVEHTNFPNPYFLPVEVFPALDDVPPTLVGQLVENLLASPRRQLALERDNLEMTGKLARLRSEIAECRQEEEVLRMRERLYREMLASPNDIYFRCDLDGCLLWVGAAIEQITGHDAGYYIGRPLRETVPEPEIIDRFLQTLRRDGRVDDYEERYPREGGQVLTVSINAHLVYGEHKQPIAFEGTLRDITERKQREQALSENARYFRSVLECVPGCIWVSSDQPLLPPIYVSGEVKQVCGYAAEDFLTGRRIFADLLLPEDRIRLYREGEIAMRERRSFVVELRIHHADGSLRWLLESAQPVYNSDGVFRGMAGVILDITDRKHAEIGLQEQHRFIRQLLDAIPIPIYFEDEHGVFQDCNTALEQYCGIPKAQIIGHSANAFVSPELAVQHARRNAELLQNGGMQSIEVSIPISPQERRDVIITLAALKRENGNSGGIVGAILDITALKKAEEHKRMLDSLRETERLRAEFLSCVSHELKTPLTPIIGMVELLLSEDLSALSGSHVKALQIIDQQSKRLHRLIADLLSLAQTECGYLKLSRCQIGLSSVVEQSRVTFEDRYRAKGLTLQADYADDLPDLFLDPQRIGQVVDNLLDNALRCTEHGGVTLRITRADALVRLEVRDTGIGFPPENAAQLFLRFFQGAGHFSGGSGLGLAIAKGFVEAHGGTISAHSTGLGLGAVFTVNLPIPHPVATVE